MEAQLLSVREVAALLPLSAAAVYALCAAGRLSHDRVGCGRGAIRVQRDDLADYLGSCRKGAAAGGEPSQSVTPRPELKKVKGTLV
jgi:excisionase family DNA binding protein